MAGQQATTKVERWVARIGQGMARDRQERMNHRLTEEAKSVLMRTDRKVVFPEVLRQDRTGQGLLPELGEQSSH